MSRSFSPNAFNAPFMRESNFDVDTNIDAYSFSDPELSDGVFKEPSRVASLQLQVDDFIQPYLGDIETSSRFSTASKDQIVSDFESKLISYLERGQVGRIRTAFKNPVESSYYLEHNPALKYYMRFASIFKDRFKVNGGDLTLAITDKEYNQYIKPSLYDFKFTLDSPICNLVRALKEAIDKSAPKVDLNLKVNKREAKYNSGEDLEVTAEGMGCYANLEITDDHPLGEDVGFSTYYREPDEEEMEEIEKSDKLEKDVDDLEDSAVGMKSDSAIAKIFKDRYADGISDRNIEATLRNNGFNNARISNILQHYKSRKSTFEEYRNNLSKNPTGYLSEFDVEVR